METYVEDGQLMIKLDSRLDSVNANIAEAEIRDAIRQHPGLPFILDAEELTYISSSGLRVLLKFHHEYNGLTITNVSTEVNEVFELTGIDSILTIHKKEGQSLFLCD